MYWHSWLQSGVFSHGQYWSFSVPMHFQFEDDVKVRTRGSSPMSTVSHGSSLAQDVINYSGQYHVHLSRAWLLHWYWYIHTHQSVFRMNRPYCGTNTNCFTTKSMSTGGDSRTNEHKIFEICTIEKNFFFKFCMKVVKNKKKTCVRGFFE